MMIDEVVQKIQERFAGKTGRIDKPSKTRAYVDIAPEIVVGAVTLLFKEYGMRFNIASAVDEFSGFEILYHFSDDAAGFVVSLRTVLDKTHPSVDTITTVTRSAWWIEREMHEMFGIDFKGNRDMRRLLLPDDWPDDVYPLRKDFVPPQRDSRKA